MHVNEVKDANLRRKSTELKTFKVLIIDDDRALLDLLNEFYKEKNFSPVTCETAEKALSLVIDKGYEFDLIVSDLNLPKKSGINFIEELTKLNIEIPVILITAYGSIEDAVIALKKGAFDYITKPLNFTELDVVSNRAIKIKNLEKNYKILKDKIAKEGKPGELLGTSPKMRELIQLIDKISQSITNVLISGESGTGKEMVARAIHERSKRSSERFVPINCSAIPNELLEAELFGYKKGAFTGANEDRKGLFEEASGGTLFLDEIGDMPLSLQAKVLRVIQEKKVKPVGETKTKDVDVRIIAATHKDLKQAIKKKEFRDDLYYRLCVIPVQVPPLREHREDIPLLASHFLKKYSQLNEKNISGFHKDAMTKLKRLRWSGNVRELENTIERAVVLSNDDIINESDITIEGSMDVDEKTSALFSELLTLKEIEKQYVQYVLDRTYGKKEEAAEILGINRKTLYRKEKEYNLG